MEHAVRIVLIVGVFVLGLWIAKFIQESPVRLDIERLENEVQSISRANETIRRENDRYRTLLRGLREDPRVMDRRAREALGMSRSQEIVIWFIDDEFRNALSRWP